MKKIQRYSAARVALIAAMAAAGAMPAGAHQLTPGQALERAIGGSQTAGRRAPALLKSEPLKLIHSGGAVAGQAAYYVFGRQSAGSGYVITSADSRLRPVLAVADSGDFNASALPENLQWWLGQYEQEIKEYLASPQAEADDAEEPSLFENYRVWEPVAPLVSTKWNQDRPFNNLCPTMADGSSTVTGCVATAMAQVIKTIGYVSPKGKKEYTANRNNLKVSFDFDSWYCDFSKMKDSYNMGLKPDGTMGFDATDEEIDQVAKLMLACGAAVNMNYCTAAQGGSGAGSPVNGLVEHLGYDAATRSLSRGSYQSNRWESIIYEQVKSGRPVYYTGTGTGGHAFVCDGYSSDGLFHFNWGWGGASDGYYALSALNPREQGIGSFEGGYNHGQTIVLFVKPGETIPDYESDTPYSMVYQGDLQVPTGSKYTDTFSLFYTLGSSPDGKSRKAGMGLLLVNADGVSPDIFKEPRNYYTLPVYSGGQSQFQVSFSGKGAVAPGTYYAYPAFCVDGVEGYWRATDIYNKPIDHFRLTIDESGKRTYVLETVRNPGIDVFDMEANDYYISDDVNSFHGIISNFSGKDFAETISLRAFDSKGAEAAKIASSILFIRNGESLPLDVTFSCKSLKAGSYEMKIYRDAYNIELSHASLKVQVKSGKRPDDSNGGKGMGPAGLCEVALWVDGTHRNLETVNLLSGQEFSGTTALQPYTPQTLDYRLAIFPHGTVSNALCSFDIAKRELSASDWVSGDAFSIKPELPAGTYTMAFVDANGTLLSYPADLNVLIQEGNLVYRPCGDGTSLAAVSLTGSVEKLEIPEKVTNAGVTYSVTELDPKALDLHWELAEVVLPGSIGKIGLDAFRGTTGLQRVYFSAPRAPFANAAIAFFGSNREVDFYVDAEHYAAYAPAFPVSGIGHLYALITALGSNDDVTLESGSEADVKLNVTPAEHFNPNFDLEVENPDVIEAAMVNGTLHIKGLAEGTSSVMLTSHQPGAGSAKVNVTVTAPVQDGIDEINAAEGRVEYFDLTGRRLAAPRGLHIRATRGTARVMAR